MDVDFAQVGQNVASTSQGVTNPRDLAANENIEPDTTATSGAENGQASSVAADINERVDRNSFNIESAVAEINEFVQSQNRQLSFSVDEDSQRAVVKVTDSDSGEVIRQIPSEEVLALSERIQALQTDVGAAVGVLFNKQV